MSSTGDRPTSCTYLIASHTQPEGVARLARTLLGESPSARIFIHHDAKAGTFPATLLAGADNVSVARDPVDAQWGTFSLVDLVLRSLREIIESENRSEWVILLSGQHYPVRPIRDFEAMLARSRADAIMSFRQVTPLDRHLNDRYGFRYRRVLDGPLPRALRAKQLYDKVFNRAQPFLRVQSDQRGSFVGVRNRSSVFDLGVPVYTGSQWWALSRSAVDTVLEAAGKQDFIDRYAATLIPDESFFQTVILNAGHLKAANIPLHYECFPMNQSSPRFLTVRDLDAIRSSRCWFSRKIDSATDGGLRDSLDAVRTDTAFEWANR